MSRVNGRNRKVSGRTTPNDCLNIAPSRIANPAIKLLPKSHFEKFGFSSDKRKYGRMATVKSAKNIKILSRLKEKNVRPNSTAKKKRTNDVSTERFFSSTVSVRNILMRDSVLIFLLTRNSRINFDNLHFIWRPWIILERENDSRLHENSSRFRTAKLDFDTMSRSSLFFFRAAELRVSHTE